LKTVAGLVDGDLLRPRQRTVDTQQLEVEVRVFVDDDPGPLLRLI